MFCAYVIIVIFVFFFVKIVILPDKCKFNVDVDLQGLPRIQGLPRTKFNGAPLSDRNGRLVVGISTKGGDPIAIKNAADLQSDQAEEISQKKECVVCLKKM